MIAKATANEEDLKNAIHSWRRREGGGVDNDAYIYIYILQYA
jgi:hypothetical protein